MPVPLRIYVSSSHNLLHCDCVLKENYSSDCWINCGNYCFVLNFNELMVARFGPSYQILSSTVCKM